MSWKVDNEAISNLEAYEAKCNEINEKRYAASQKAALTIVVDGELANTEGCGRNQLLLDALYAAIGEIGVDVRVADFLVWALIRSDLLSEEHNGPRVLQATSETGWKMEVTAAQLRAIANYGAQFV